MPLPSPIPKILHEALSQIHAQEGSILLAEPDGLRFACCVTPRAAVQESKLVGHLVRRGKGIVGLAFAFQQPMTVADVKSDPTHDESVDALAGTHTRSEAVVPLSTPEHEFGVLTAINSASGTGFSTLDLDVLISAAAAISAQLAQGAAHAR